MTEQSEAVEAPAVEAEAPTEAVEAPPDQAPDMQALQQELSALREALEASKLEKVAAETKAQEEAEAIRVASLSEKEKLAEEVAGYMKQIESDKAELMAERRSHTLVKLGVPLKFHGWAPDVDPKSKEGQVRLEKWVAEHPEIIKAAPAPKTDSLADKVSRKSSAIADILSGKKKSSLLTPESIAKMLG
tara:strand:+ start:1153 stop:1719 length:567 start_codon:yes stop_codon:yes gene_type:complete